MITEICLTFTPILSISFLNERMACSKLIGLDSVVELSIFNKRSYSNFLIKASADYLEQPKNFRILLPLL